MDDIATTLAAIRQPGAFAVRRTLAADHLRLEVQGVGPIALPVSNARARKLCTVARPARFGLRDRTLLDREVRDTWEVARSRVRIDQRRWKQALRPELERIRRELGLPDGCELAAELHKLLVYGPGQFFATHQDTEKTDGMIGSLVVTLPSEFKGGALVVEHHDARIVSRGSAAKLSLVAFYADCHHAVQPIREGYRVALTYNLILKGDARVAVPERPVAALTAQLRAFFETPRPARYSSEPQPPPDRLVYLLDHQYTEKSLAWAGLKNADAARAAALQEAARRLDCEIFLALADVHEVWSCGDDDSGYGFYDYRYDHYRDDVEDEDEDEEEEAALDEADHPSLIDLVDDDVELRHFIGSGEGLPAASSRVDAYELCFTKPSVELEPFRFEHEPFMGNSGNTVDRWYHRAAVVLWPRERAFAVRARASAAWALAELVQAQKRSAPETAQRMVEQLLPFWAGAVRTGQADRLLAKALDIAAGLDEPDLAAALLRPFQLEQLSAKAAPRLPALLERYGLAWCRSVLAGWMGARLDQARESWLPSLPALVDTLCTDGGPDGVELARWFTAEQWRGLEASARATVGYASPSAAAAQLARLHQPILALLESARLTGDAGLRGDMLRALTDPEVSGPVLNLVRLLRQAHKSLSRPALRALELDALAAHCRDELTSLLARPPRADDDWSMHLPADCPCELCRQLRAFLEVSHQVRLEWPLAKDKRAHVHQTIDRHELPVTHTTRRTGRPYTLVLEKTQALFRREAKEREAWQTELRWLEGQR